MKCRELGGSKLAAEPSGAEKQGDRMNDFIGSFDVRFFFYSFVRSIPSRRDEMEVAQSKRSAALGKQKGGISRPAGAE
jgi:hypothetical protein